MLLTDWWITHEDEKWTKPAITFGFAKHFYSAVQQKLDDNFINDVFPSSWNQFTSAMNFERSQTSRKRNAKSTTHLDELLRIATLLDVDVHVLFPDAKQWISTSTEKLLALRGISVSATDVKWFTEYLWQLFNHNRKTAFKTRDEQLSERCVSSAAAALNEPEDDVRTVLVRVLEEVRNRGNDQ